MKKIILVLIISMFMISGCMVGPDETSTEIISPLNFLENAVVTEDLTEDKLEKGECYITSFTKELASGESEILSADTDGRLVNMELRKITVIDLSNSVIEARVDLYENVSIDNQGTPIPIYNLDRDFTKGVGFGNNTLELYNGTQLNYTGSNYIEPLSEYFSSERKQSSTSLGQQIQYILARNETYGYNISNVGSGDIEFKTVWRWCESEKVEY